MCFFRVLLPVVVVAAVVVVIGTVTADVELSVETENHHNIKYRIAKPHTLYTQDFLFGFTPQTICTQNFLFG